MLVSAVTAAGVRPREVHPHRDKSDFKEQWFVTLQTAAGKPGCAFCVQGFELGALQAGHVAGQSGEGSHRTLIVMARLVR